MGIVAFIPDGHDGGGSTGEGELWDLIRESLIDLLLGERGS